MKCKILWIAWIAASVTSIGELSIKPGDSVSNVVAAFGAPSGTAIMNGRLCYIYDGGVVVIKDDKVVSFPKDFEATTQRKQQVAQYEASQKAKGLILYDGQWVTPEHKTRLEDEAKKLAVEAEPKLLLLNWSWREDYGYAIAEGEVQNISSEALKGIMVTVTFYTADDKLITSDESFIKFDPILSGQTSPFRVSASYNPEMRTARINFKKLWGGTIPWKKR